MNFSTENIQSLSAEKHRCPGGNVLNDRIDSTGSKRFCIFQKHLIENGFVIIHHANYFDKTLNYILTKGK